MPVRTFHRAYIFPFYKNKHLTLKIVKKSIQILSDGGYHSAVAIYFDTIDRLLADADEQTKYITIFVHLKDKDFYISTHSDESILNIKTEILKLKANSVFEHILSMKALVE